MSDDKRRAKPREPSVREGLKQARDMRRAIRTRLESTDGELYAETIRGRGDKWNIRRRGDNYTGKAEEGADRNGRVFGTLETRNRRAVQAVLDALEPFHQGDTL